MVRLYLRIGPFFLPKIQFAEHLHLCINKQGECLRC